MRKFLAGAAVLFAAFGAPQAGLAQDAGCHKSALGELKRLSPRGYAVYTAMSDKKQFLTWLTCDDIQLGLSTAVHESVHLLVQERNAFPLVNGGQVRRPNEVSAFLAPKTVAGRFANDSYVQTYLRPGSASSADDLLYLLDELNAYSHDLNTAVRLAPIARKDRKVDHRDGLTAMMAFFVAYADAARKAPATWQGLQKPETKKVLSALWQQAERVLDGSCGMPGFGMNDHAYMQFMRNPKNNAGFTALMGRAPNISRECLAPAYTSSAGAG